MLEDLAGHCRRALEAMTMSERGARLRDFPHGACGDAAEVFGRIVRETMGRVGVYALGGSHPELPPQQSHAWFELDGLIVDLTHDQFPDTGLQGWVFVRSPWHAKFTVERLSLCLDPTSWMEYPHAAYRAMRDAVAAATRRTTARSWPRSAGSPRGRPRTPPRSGTHPARASRSVARPGTRSPRARVR